MHNLQKPIVGTLVQGYPPPLPEGGNLLFCIKAMSFLAENENVEMKSCWAEIKIGTFARQFMPSWC